MAEPGIENLSDPKSFSQIEKFFEETFYKNKYSDRNPYESNPSQLSRFSPRVVSNYVQNVLQEMSPTGKGLSFILSRQALSALNPTFGMGQIANPVAPLIGPPPGAGGLTTTKLDVISPESNPGTRIAKNQERLKKLYEGSWINVRTVAGVPPVEIEGPGFRYQGNLNNPQGQTMADKKRELNIATNDQNYSELQPIDYSSPPGEEIRFGNVRLEEVDGVTIEKPNFETLFTQQSAGPAFQGSQAGALFNKPIPGARDKRSSSYIRRERALENDDTFFSFEDANKGYIDTNENLLLTDDDFYIPFYFSDLRRPERRIYFKAFLTDFSEKFAVDWNKNKYYGRVDPVGTYQNTDRTLNIGWKIAAMSRPGLSSMWKKINNFLKMLYPTFVDGLVSAAPLVRVRIGDVIADGAGLGLPGFINSADISYNETVWEIDSYFDANERSTGKVPMVCQMNISFQVIHERNPAVDSEYNFDTSIFRRIGKLQTPREDSPAGQESPSGDFDDLLGDIDRNIANRNSEIE